jgi:hypothetical protein
MVSCVSIKVFSARSFSWRSVRMRSANPNDSRVISMADPSCGAQIVKTLYLDFGHCE